MTEAEWLACNDPRRMLAFLRGKVTERRLRLFACGFCSPVDGLLDDGDCRAAVEVAERFADGSAGTEELAGARNTARLVWASGFWSGMVAAEAAEESAWHAAIGMTSSLEMETIDTSYWLLQRNVLCNVFGPLLFRPFASAKRARDGGTVARLVATIYADRGFDRLPLLADALEDSGCSDAELLGHLCGPGPHVRGCWALDLQAP